MLEGYVLLGDDMGGYVLVGDGIQGMRSLYVDKP